MIHFLSLPFRSEHSDYVMHTGIFASTGAAMAAPRGGLQVCYLLENSISTEERGARKRRADAIMGEPFVRLTGVSEHKVFGLPTGAKVRLDAIEMVYNDAIMLDEICGEGTYVRLMRPDVEVVILGVAQKLYAGAAS